MADSKIKTKAAEVKKGEAKTTKPVVVKKVSHAKQPANKEVDKQLKVAIDKYKDIPLGELYEDLNGTEAYKDILKARREELLKAKAIVDSSKRKVAIAKTSENTVEIEFRYQKNATFKNHYVPKGNYNVVNSGSKDTEGDVFRGRDRVLERSQERAISDAPQTVSTITPIAIRPASQEPRQVNITSTLEQRTDRPIGPAQQQAPMQQPRPQMTREMPMQQPMPAPTPVAPMQQPVQPIVTQQPQPMMQPMPVQQPVQAPIAQPESQPVAQVVAAPVEEKYKKNKFWPLYQQIELASEQTKSSKVVFSITVVLSVVLALLVALFVLWGFAIHWEWNNFQDIPFTDAFKNLFNVF